MDRKRQVSETVLEKALFYSSAANPFGAEESDAEQEGSAVPESRDESAAASRVSKPAWNDEDDADLEVDLVSSNRTGKLRKSRQEQNISGSDFEARLKNLHATLHSSKQSSTKWASLDAAESGNHPSELKRVVMHAGNLTRRDPSVLPQKVISIQRGKECSRIESTVRALEFHPTIANMLAYGGMDAKLKIVSVDGAKNHLLSEIPLPKLPITCARFTSDTQIVMGGYRPFFYTYDLNKQVLNRVLGIVGKSEKSFDKFVVSQHDDRMAFVSSTGSIMMVSKKTHFQTGELRASGKTMDMAFSSDGTQMVSAQSDGQVYIWDMRSSRCLARFHDDGCMKATSIALSEDSKHLAVGSNSGVVNLYARSSEDASSWALQKSILNLTTTVDGLVFHPSSELLMTYSKSKKDAARLVHVSSGSVFANFPDPHKHPLKHVYSAAFSRQMGGWMMVGNDAGVVQSYRLQHYARS
eukprot:ANDGO_03713.mRNA.1 U3 small nucleolar RNA-associated protein 18 homolog